MAAPNSKFKPGSSIEVINKTVLRESESVDSPKIEELQTGTVWVVQRLGEERRLCVQETKTGKRGWISCETNSGKQLIRHAGAVLGSMRPNQGYAVGQEIVSLKARVPMRAAEDMNSPKTGELGEGEAVTVTAIGNDREGRRLQVQIQSGHMGWISCQATSGAQLVIAANLAPQFEQQQQQQPPQPQPQPSQPAAPLRGAMHDQYVCTEPQGTRSYRESPQSETCAGDGIVYAFADIIKVPLGQHDSNFVRTIDGFYVCVSKLRKLATLDVQENAEFVVCVRLPTMAALLKGPVEVKPGTVVVPSIPVAPGLPVCCLEKVEVMGPKRKVWFRVKTESGAQGWLPEKNEKKQDMLTQFTSENTDGCFTITSKKAVQVFNTPVLAGGTVTKTLKPGEMVTYNSTMSTDGLVFYRLNTGGWMCDHDDRGHCRTERLQKEEHWWTYVCEDRDGAVIRTHPTRDTSMNTDRKISHRQRVVASKKVTLANGDAFIYIEHARGWAPLMKKDGRGAKMQALQPVPHAAQRVPSAPSTPLSMHPQSGFAPSSGPCFPLSAGPMSASPLSHMGPPGPCHAPAGFPMSGGPVSAGPMSGGSIGPPMGLGYPGPPGSYHGMPGPRHEGPHFGLQRDPYPPSTGPMSGGYAGCMQPAPPTSSERWE